MGTETYQLLFQARFEFCFYVKLNNPLMGTETYDVYVDDTEATLKVKLNNPLMGTETAVCASMTLPPRTPFS